MARYVVVEFADNQSAEQLIQKLHDASERGAMYRVVGLFVKPRRTCDCPAGPQGMNYRGDSLKARGGVVYGAKYGWWVCTVCKRPRKAGHQLLNQLKGEDLYPEPGEGEGDWEMMVTQLSVTGIHKKNITHRVMKKLKKKKEK